MKNKNLSSARSSFKKVKPERGKKTGIARALLSFVGLFIVAVIVVFALDNDDGGILYEVGQSYSYIDENNYNYSYQQGYDYDSYDSANGYSYYGQEQVGYYGEAPVYVDGSYAGYAEPNMAGYEEHGGYIGDAPGYGEHGGYVGHAPSGGYIGIMPAGFTGTPIGPFDPWPGNPVMDGTELQAAISAVATPGVTRIIYVGADITMTAAAATRDIIADRDIWIRGNGGTNFVILSSGTNRHFNVSGGGRLTLSNITLSRSIPDVVINTPPAAPTNHMPPTGNGGGVSVGANGTLVMENGAVIRHNRAATFGGGVVVDGANARFHMNGGAIRNNQSYRYGGGVHVTGTTSRFYMNGGVIGGDHSTPHENLPRPAVATSGVNSGTHLGSDAATAATNARPLLPFNNYAQRGGGGGLSLAGGAQFIMNRPAGCVCHSLPVGSLPAGQGCICTTPPGTGVIAGNIAVYSDAGQAAWAAGGLHASDHHTVIRMYGGAIRGNYAGNNGGGVALRNYASSGGGASGAAARDAADANRIMFHFIGGAIEDNFSARNMQSAGHSRGYGGGGGVAIAHFSSFIMYEGATIRRNSAATQGGGVRLRDDGARFIMYGGEIVENRVLSVITNEIGGGGGISLSSADGQSGRPPAVILHSGLIAYNSTVSTNAALGAGGGGININRGDVHIRGAGNVVIRNNTSPGHGGGIVWHANGRLFTAGANLRTAIGDAPVANPAYANTGYIDITNNTAGIGAARHGGGIHIAGFGFEGSNFRINNNTATAQGGGVFASQLVILENSIIDRNTAGTSGGGIHNAGEVRLYRSSISGNEAGTSGGGIHTTGAGAVHIQQCVINGNEAGTTGGGLHATSNVTILGSTIGRRFTCDSAVCICTGYLGNTDGLDICREFLGNTAGENGGGLYVVGGNATLITINYHNYQNVRTDSFIEGNTATLSGGGIYFRGAGVGTAAQIAARTPRITMHHGFIRGNTARGHVISAAVTYGGGGVFIHGVTGVNSGDHASAATFTMHAGEISGNTAVRGGGLFMSGAHRTGGAGASWGGEFIFNSGLIYDNRAVCRTYFHPALTPDGGDGGGVFMDGSRRNATAAGIAHGSRFNMNGGYIEGNRATRNGGGVFLDRGQAPTATSAGVNNARGSDFVMNTGYIRGNTAGYITADGFGTGIGDGGGVYLDGLTLYDNNTINADSVARFSMTSGSINGNTARDGGGVFVGGGRRVGSQDTAGNDNAGPGGRFTIGGTSSVSGNTATRNGGGIYLGGGHRSGTGRGGRATGATLNMSGTTTINNNNAINGGGIYAGGVIDETLPPIVAGTRTASSAVINITGEATIVGNTASQRGGGVHLAGNYLPASTAQSPYAPSFNVNFGTSGSIANNTAQRGGGVYVGGGHRHGTGAGEGVIFGAQVVLSNNAVIGPGNHATMYGGGVYVSGGVREGAGTGGSTGGSLRMGGGAMVYGNSSAGHGGGIVLRTGRDIGTTAPGNNLGHPGAILSLNNARIVGNAAGYGLNHEGNPSTGGNGGGLWIPNLADPDDVVPFFNDLPLATAFAGRPNDNRNNRRLRDAEISNNRAYGNTPNSATNDGAGHGGGIWLGHGLDLYLLDSRVISNVAGRYGGSIFLHSGIEGGQPWHGRNALHLVGGYLSGGAQRGGGVYIQGGTVAGVDGALFNMVSSIPAIAAQNGHAAIPAFPASGQTAPPVIGIPAGALLPNGSPMPRAEATIEGGGIFVGEGVANNAGVFNMTTGAVGAGTADARRGSIAHGRGGGVFVQAGTQPGHTGGRVFLGAAGSTAPLAFAGNETITETVTGFDGGGIFIQGGTSHANRGIVTINTTGPLNFTGNRAGRDGGAIYMDPGPGDYPGLLYRSGQSFNLTNITFTGNMAIRDGGAIWVPGNLPNAMTLSGATFTGNEADRDGGAIWLDEEAELVMTAGTNLISGGRAGRHGGGVFLSPDSEFTFSGGDITGNRAVRGGGVYVDGPGRPVPTPTPPPTPPPSAGPGGFIGEAPNEINGGEISEAPNEIGDDATGIFGRIRDFFTPSGNGISPLSTSSAVFTMTGGSISNNIAGSGGLTPVTGHGGGVWVAYFGYFNVNNVAFSNNQAFGRGGAIYTQRYEYRDPLLRVPGWTANALAYSNIVFGTGTVNNFSGNTAVTAEIPPFNAGLAIPYTLFGGINNASGTAPYNRHVINNSDINFSSDDILFTFIKRDNFIEAPTYNNNPIPGVVFYLYRSTSGNASGPWEEVMGSSLSSPLPPLVSSNAAATLGHVYFSMTQSVYRLREVSVPGTTWMQPQANWVWILDATGASVTVTQANNIPQLHQVSGQWTLFNNRMPDTILFEFHKTDQRVYSTLNHMHLLDHLLEGATFRLFRVPIAEVPAGNGLINLAGGVPTPWTEVTPTAGERLVSTDNVNQPIAFYVTYGYYYQLVEVLAPVGFQLPRVQWRFRINNDAIEFDTIGTEFPAPDIVPRPCACGWADELEDRCNNALRVSFFLGNFLDFELPLSGGMGTAMYAISGSALIAMSAVVALAVSVKKKRVAKPVVRYQRTR